MVFGLFLLRNCPSESAETCVHRLPSQPYVIHALPPPAPAWRTLGSSPPDTTVRCKLVGGEAGLHGATFGGTRLSFSYTVPVGRDSQNSGPSLCWLQYSDTGPFSAADLAVVYYWKMLEAGMQGIRQSRFAECSYTVKSSEPVFPPVTVANNMKANARLGYRVISRCALTVSGQELEALQSTKPSDSIQNGVSSSPPPIIVNISAMGRL